MTSDTAIEMLQRKIDELNEQIGKANAELRIEAALERVRAKAMAMHKSDDLHGAVTIMFEEFQKLNLNVLRCGIGILNKDSRTGTVWTTSVSDNGLAIEISADESFDIHPLMDLIYECWQKQEDLDYVLQGQDLMDYYRAMDASELKLPKSQLSFSDDELQPQYYYAAMFNAGGLYSFSDKPFTSEDRKIMRRFASVVNLTYNRFLDLQKAEAQAKEAQIEAALERIRARAMAMHSSNEVTEVAGILREQMGLLNQPELETSVVNLLDEDPQKVHSWHAFRQPGSSEKVISGMLSFPKNSSELAREMIVLYKEGKKEFTIEASGKKLEEFTQVLINAEPEIEKYTSVNPPLKVYYHFATFRGGTLLTISYQPPTDDIKSLQRRAASVFDMAYRRYLDLKNLEAQTREAQIETGLERVRSKTMAMHKSEEVTGVAVSLNEELMKLGFEGGSTIIIIDEETGDTEQWTGFSEDRTLKSCYVPYFKHPFHDALLEAWQNDEKFFVYTIQGDEKGSLDEHYFSTGYKIFPENDKKWMRAMNSVTFSHAFMKYGAIHWGPDHLTEEQLKILQRFAKVFEQSYTRFLDLKKAEAQAREAQIEAALERVRARTMAMHKSDELLEVITVIAEQLRQLNFKFDNVSFGINSTGKDFDFWMAGGGQLQPIFIHAPYLNNPLIDRVREAQEEGIEFFADRVEKNDNEKWLKHLFAHKAVDFSEETKSYLLNSPGLWRSNVLRKNINLFICNYFTLPYTDEQNTTLIRFANVFEQSYTRFLDLQKAEAQAREAQIELGLERVRARAMAMQNSDELNDLVRILFEELTRLDLVLARCIIWILDNESLSARLWMANSEDKRSANSYFIKRIDHPYYNAIIHAWRERISKWTYELQGEDKSAIDHILLNETELAILPQAVKEGILNSEHTIVSGSFNNFGLLEASGPFSLTEEQLDIIHRFSKVFDLTYTRFNDLKLAEQMAKQAEIDLIKLKEEKKRTEDALTELQATQKQLVQSEKMASLGELTAGIAHEIQNPLNFVNNFSDVSNELLEEMKEQLANGNAQSAIGIADDVKDNLEKILHHGKRADAIVKSMLQHSRSNTGKKEPTDINALAEEYSRLAYHGLRAKDKSFNTKFETDLDTSIDKINIVPQEMGRVILNLINNAFYAVTEKKNRNTNRYEPLVTLSTKKMDDKIEIKVKDNGDGIPQRVLDKIFQPFFTTKPTGQGTGLGLSLSYDIVTKGHGGDIKVETKEGTGSEFIISLPVN